MTKGEQGLRKKFLRSISELLHSKDCLNIKNVRIACLKYMLIFPLAPVFANMQGALFSDSVRIFNLDAMTLMGSTYCIGAGVFFAAAKFNTIAKMSHILALITGTTFILWLLMPESQGSLCVAMIFAGSLGGCAACAFLAYTFALNNTERFLGASLISLFFVLNQLDYGLVLISGFFDKIYLTGLVLGTCICLLSYKPSDFSEVGDRPKATLNPALKLALYFFIAHYFIEILYTYIPGASDHKTILANGATGIVVVILVILLQFLTKRSIWNMCNIFFIAMILTYALSFMPEDSIFRSIARLLHGFEQMGYIAAYYLLGCVFKKHGDFRIFKLCLVTILPLSAVAYLIPGEISAHAPELLYPVTTLMSVIVFIIFVLLSPAYSKYLFFSDWSDDFYGPDMVEKLCNSDCLNTLENYGLSPREQEVTMMLLNGENAKSIATKLDISTHTVNFHIKNIYKKLNINNRGELFAHLGNLNTPLKDEGLKGDG